MNAADFAMMFGLGLAGSLHCVQMCGPLVLSFGIPMAAQPRARQAAAHIAYHLGRVTTYASLGAAAGCLGAGMTWAGRLAGIENTAALVAGIFMVIAGLLMMDLVRGSSLVRIGPASWLSRAAGRLLQSPAVRTKFGMGLLLGFLPCGLIYAALLKSVAAGDGWSGAAGMLMFGLGTAAPLVALGLFSGFAGRWFAGRTTRWAGVCVTAMGIFLIWRGWTPVTLAGGHHH